MISPEIRWVATGKAAFSVVAPYLWNPLPTWQTAEVLALELFRCQSRQLCSQDALLKRSLKSRMHSKGLYACAHTHINIQDRLWWQGKKNVNLSCFCLLLMLLYPVLPYSLVFRGGSDSRARTRHSRQLEWALLLVLLMRKHHWIRAIALKCASWLHLTMEITTEVQLCRTSCWMP